MQCKVCGATRGTAEFYDSITSYCKPHWRERVKANRRARREQYAEYERSRANLPHRVSARQAYAATDGGRSARSRAQRQWQERNPVRRAAQVAVSNAVRDGRLQPLPCLECGATAEAHHPDYSRPLDVVWLCTAHHKQAHALGRRILRQEAQTAIPAASGKTL